MSTLNITVPAEVGGSTLTKLYVTPFTIASKKLWVTRTKPKGEGESYDSIVVTFENGQLPISQSAIFEIHIDGKDKDQWTWCKAGIEMIGNVFNASQYKISTAVSDTNPSILILDITDVVDNRDVDYYFEVIEPTIPDPQHTSPRPIDAPNSDVVKVQVVQEENFAFGMRYIMEYKNDKKPMENGIYMSQDPGFNSRR